jgi:membrane-bound serine protease (ClpP class)
MKVIRLIAAAFMVLSLGSVAGAAEPTHEIVGVSLNGVVDPFEASYLSGAISDANRDGAPAILLTIDTPGGLDSSMRKIVQSILSSPVPVICYVGPEGARAASAGAFILLSCDVASMAPGTNVGAASPVGVSGVTEQTKALNDAAAYIRSLAEQKDRNPDWAESAVREAASVSAEEALDLGVIDSVQASQADVLADANGATVEKNGAPITIDIEGATVADREMGLGTRLLHGLLSPDLAFLFFYLGIGLLIVEVIHPGISVPGITGALSLVAAFAAFGMLPVQLVGIILLLGSAGLFLLELKHPGVSVAGIGGLVTLVAGGLLLFDPSVPGAQVSPLVIAPVAVAMALFFAFLVPAALSARRLPVVTGTERLIGAEGVVVRELSPRGSAQIASELWTAESMSGTIAAGQHVRVVAAEGLRLKVEPVLEIHEEDLTEKLGGRA